VRKMRRVRSGYLGFAKWIGTATGVAGAVLIALNIGAVAAGFALFLISSVLWSAVGWLHREPKLVVLQGAFTAINLLGIYRWANF
jgi:uncharacterized membrane protein